MEHGGELRDAFLERHERGSQLARPSPVLASLVTKLGHGVWRWQALRHVASSGHDAGRPERDAGVTSMLE